MPIDTSPLPSVTGGPRVLLRLEGFVLGFAAVLLYSAMNLSWWTFAALILAPDLSFVAYLAGARAGAIAYNAVHTTIVPGLLATMGYALGDPLLEGLALVWLAHIGFDRALGYGLKYANAFANTHLGPIGR